MKLRNASAFFAHVRAGRLLGPVLTTPEVQGTTALLTAFEKADWPKAYGAYGLATAYHETGHTMQPIHEKGSRAYLDKYDTGKLAAALGNTPEDDDDGIKYAGRGYVQLTGARNYALACRKLGVDFLGNPDLAMNPAHAANIMVYGMRDGWFTGKSLATTIANPDHGTHNDFLRARRIINGTDRAELIAGYAIEFQDALTIGQWS